MQSLLKIAEKLGNPQPAGHGYKVQCPVHEDDKPSLSIWFDKETGRLCWNCFAGCEHSKVEGGIRYALGLAEKDALPTLEPQAIYYDYKDESGKLLFRKVRKPGKEFFIDREMKDVRKILYNTHLLPEWEGPVIIVEGEKDADRLTELGFLGVTNPYGAKNWRQDYSEQLRDKVCVIVSDFDDAGTERNKHVSDYLHGTAQSVEIVGIEYLFQLIHVTPWKGCDIYDWFDKGGTPEVFRSAIPSMGPSLALQTAEGFKDTLTLIETKYQEEGDIWGLPTGFEGLDEITGGLQRGELIVIGARPGTGKTSLGLNIAQNLFQKRILFASLEMSRTALSMRLMCTIAEVDSKRIRAKDLAEGDWRVLTDAAAQCANSKLLIDDIPGASVEQIAATARREHAKVPLDLVIVDYLQLVKSEEYKTDKRLSVGAAAQGLKDLAKELDIPVVPLAQLKREAEFRTANRNNSQARPPVMADLKESGEIEQAADVILFLWENPSYPGTRELTVGKHRNGPVGHIRLLWDAPITKFSTYHKYTPPKNEPDLEGLGEVDIQEILI